jgi:hypothetical protein
VAVLPTGSQSLQLTTWAVTIVLPPKVVAGHPATLAVLGVDGRLAPGVAVQLGNNQRVRTDETGRALFVAPSSGDVLLANASGTSAAALVDSGAANGTQQAIAVAPVASLRDRFPICGQGLRGEADADRVKINGEPALVLAASPECVVILPGPKAAPGPAKISVETPGAQWTATTTLVSLDFEAPEPPLVPDKKSQLHVRVVGSEERLRIVVANRTPGVIRFLRGETQQVLTSGGAQNLGEVKIETIRSGDFSFHAWLVSAADVDAGWRYMQAAQPLASKHLRHDLVKLSNELKRHPHDSDEVRSEVEQILSVTMTGDLRTLLDAACAAL